MMDYFTPITFRKTWKQLICFHIGFTSHRCLALQNDIPHCLPIMGENILNFIKVHQYSVLHGLNHADSAIKWYILGVKKLRKKYMLTCSFHLQKAPITASSENVPDSQCSAHGGKYDYFCQIKRFKCSYSKIFL